MEQKILIVDDEQDIREILSFNLQNEGYEVCEASSAEEALEKLSPDHALILLDVMMGGMSGYRLAEKLRKKGNTMPIIFLTAKDTENDMLTGFSVGGDDYISKPFSLKEVSARVRAVLKRSAGAEVKTDDRLTIDDLAIDFQTKELFIAGNVIPLTKTEFEILTLLVASPSHLFSREEIINQLWSDYPYTTGRTVDVHIARLRKKMGGKAEWISSRPGYGYRFNPNEK
ncbi:MAG: response regulator transcription factor [Bacteroidales bacterium]|jgi:DNA-binding response OmpR family regulator|nr:response regulator transcription factor [Bacteroidales bacterium]